MEIMEQPETIFHIRTEVRLWDEVLLAVMRAAQPSTAVVLRLLRAGIEFRHLANEIYDLAQKEEDHALSELVQKTTSLRYPRRQSLPSLIQHSQTSEPILWNPNNTINSTRLLRKVHPKTTSGLAPWYGTHDIQMVCIISAQYIGILFGREVRSDFETLCG